MLAENPSGCYVGASKEAVLDWLVQYRNCYREEGKLFLANPNKAHHELINPSIFTYIATWRELDETEAASYLAMPREPTAIVATAVSLCRDTVDLSN